DLAVAAGNDLVIVHGSDRKLSIDEEERSKVAPPEVETQEMPFTLSSIAIGNFTRNDHEQIAALSDDGVIHVIERSAKQAWGKVTADIATPLHAASVSLDAAKTNATLVKARVSVSGFDDVVVVDSVNRQLHIVSNGVQSTDSSRAVAPVSEPRAVATGSRVTNPQSAIRNPQSTDPVASTTPSGLPAWGTRSARGTDTQDPTKVGTLNTRARSTNSSRWSHHRQKGPTKVGTLTPGVRVPTSVGSLTTLDVEADPVALLPMRLNSDALSDLVILKRGGVSPLAIAPTVPLATFEVNSTGDEHDVNQGDGKCETAPGNKTCTLRAAIEEVDAKAGSYAINFSVSSITVGSQLRSIFLSPGTLSVTIDGGS